MPGPKVIQSESIEQGRKIDIFSPEFVARSSPFTVRLLQAEVLWGGFNKRHVDSRNNPREKENESDRLLCFLSNTIQCIFLSVLLLLLYTFIMIQNRTHKK